jgi:hypothetical protein
MLLIGSLGCTIETTTRLPLFFFQTNQGYVTQIHWVRSPSFGCDNCSSLFFFLPDPFPLRVTRMGDAPFW